MSFDRFWIELYGVLKCVQRVGKVLLIAQHNSEQVVAFHTLGISFELLLDLLLCLIQFALAEQFLSFSKSWRGLGYWLGLMCCAVIGSSLLGVTG